MDNTSSSLVILIYDASEKYAFYSKIFFLTGGLISNLALILVFTILPTFRGNQCAFLLTVECISNIGLFLSTYSDDLYTYVTGWDLTITSLLWCKLQHGLPTIFGIGSLFTICFLTFDQFMSTNPRPNWRQVSTLKLAHRLTLLNICFVVLHSIPFMIYAEIQEANGCDIYNKKFRSYMIFFSYPILSSVAPIIFNVTFSLLAYCNVRRIVRRQVAVNRRRLDRQLTAMVLARICCLILLGLPYIIVSVFLLNFSKTQDNQLDAAIVRMTTVITNSLVYLNFAVKQKLLFNNTFVFIYDTSLSRSIFMYF